MEFYGMSSSSSSECNCYLCEVGLDCRNVRPTPFYPTMGQPLIYYADVPNHRSSKQSKRPNCFVRAFRWYTDDLSSNKRQDLNPNVSGFATWLDAKYEQFLQESEDPHDCGIKVTQTSFIVSCTAPACTPETEPSEPCCAKKRIFGNLKSAQRKRKTSKSDDERRCCEANEKVSMEFILLPKDISRAASACCRVTPTSCCSVKQRCAGKSQSLTSVTHNKDIVEDETKKPVKFDNPPVEKKSQVLRPSETREIKPEKLTQNDASLQCSDTVERNDAGTQCENCQSTVTIVTKELSFTPNRNSSCSRASTQVENSKHKEEKKHARVPKDEVSKTSRLSKSNVSCQCPVEPKVDSQIQSEDQERNSQTARREICLGCRCPNCSTNISKAAISDAVPLIPSSAQDTTPALSAAPQCCPCLSPQPCPSLRPESTSLPVQNVIISTTPFVEQEGLAGKCSANCPYLRSSRCQATECVGVQHIQSQTSETAIDLDANFVHGYPLYMKIVCADRPSQDPGFAK